MFNYLKKLMNFGYNATESTPKRKAPSSILQSEDGELTFNKRAALVSTTRDLLRNFSAAKWAVNRSLDMVSKFSFQSRSGNDAFDQQFERLMSWWSEPKNCDIAGRHSFDRFTRLLEASATVDGDVFLVMLQSGHIQAIEADRVRTPSLPELEQVGLPKDINVIDGVVVDNAGKMLGICVFTRKDSRFVFDRYIEGQYVLQHGYFDFRFDQVRGISPIAASLNTFRDIMDASEYALVQAKIASLFGIKFTRKEGAGDFPTNTEEEETTGYQVDFGKGAFLLDMEPGDDASFLQSALPSNQFQDYMKMMLAIAMKALDIPYSQWDESFTNYSGSRQAMLQANQSASRKQANLKRVLDEIVYWKLNTWVATGLITLPPNTTVNMIDWEFVAEGLPWIDPQSEVNAQILSINAGLNSRTRICKELGADFQDIAAELAKEQELLKSLGINPSATPMQSIQINTGK